MLSAAHAWRLLAPLVIALAGCSLLVDQNLADKPGEDLGLSSGGAGSGGSAGSGGGAAVWEAMSTAFAPRVDAAAAWIGSGMFVWGGFDDAADRSDGAIYDPAKNAWTAVSSASAPSPRSLAVAVWTGSRVVVFGGGPSQTGEGINDGAEYDPASDTWSTLNPPGPPSAGRRRPIAFWTGSLAVFWGGEADGAPLSSGLRYEPSTQSWSSVDKNNAPGPRRGSAWAWTGSKLLMFGGTIDGIGATSEGFEYDPELDEWSAMGSSNAPSPRYDAFAVWMGGADGNGEFLVWGGRGADDKELNSGARYNPATGEWKPIPTQGSPSKRAAPVGEAGIGAWTGLRAVLVGGIDGPSFKTDGSVYEPASDAWRAPVTSWPSGQAHERGVSVWTGQEIILWSGRDNSGSLLDVGERFMP